MADILFSFYLVFCGVYIYFYHQINKDMKKGVLNGLYKKLVRI